MDEIWKPIPGYGGYYEASSIGRIRSIDRTVIKRHKSGKVISQNYSGKILRLCKRSELGHMVVHIGFDGKKSNVSVHRMVLLAFVGEPLGDQEACHNNGIASDNRIENLRWDTHLENNRDRKRHGTYLQGSSHKMAKLDEKQVIEIKKSGIGCAEVSRKYGISLSQAHRICTGKSWTHINPEALA